MASGWVSIILALDFSRRGGRPSVPLEIRWLIREMSLANPFWGAPRIHGELLKLGIDVGQTSVAKYMARRRVGAGCSQRHPVFIAVQPVPSIQRTLIETPPPAMMPEPPLPVLKPGTEYSLAESEALVNQASPKAPLEPQITASQRAMGWMVVPHGQRVCRRRGGAAVDRRGPSGGPQPGGYDEAVRFAGAEQSLFPV